MSEEIAASIGDVLAENARLKSQLAEAETWRLAARRLERRNEQTKAVNFDLNVQLLESHRLRAQNALDSSFWTGLLADVDRTADKLVAIAVAHHANHQAALDAARRLVAAWRAERQFTREWHEAWLRDAINARVLLRRTLTARADGRTMDMHAALDALAELLNEGKS